MEAGGAVGEHRPVGAGHPRASTVGGGGQREGRRVRVRIVDVGVLGPGWGQHHDRLVHQDLVVAGRAAAGHCHVGRRDQPDGQGAVPGRAEGASLLVHRRRRGLAPHGQAEHAGRNRIVTVTGPLHCDVGGREAGEVAQREQARCGLGVGVGAAPVRGGPGGHGNQHRAGLAGNRRRRDDAQVLTAGRPLEAGRAELVAAGEGGRGRRRSPAEGHRYDGGPGQGRGQDEFSPHAGERRPRVLPSV